MSSEVFSRTESVFFVCNGSANAGGCTLQYIIDNGGFANFDKSKIMNGAGDPIAIGLSATYVDATGIITEGTGGDFDDAEVGMIIYIEEDIDGDFEEPGRYEITAVGAGTITIESGVNEGRDETTVDVNIGGSFDTISNALDNITAADAGGHHDCYLFTNKNESGETAPQVSGGGSATYNTKLFIVGFNTTLLDMMPGGAYYQSCYDAWYDGIDADCHIEIDLGGSNYFLVDADCVIIHNLNIKDGLLYTLLIGDTNIGTVLFNCILSGAEKTLIANNDNPAICLFGCYLFDGSTNLVRQNGSQANFVFVGCVLDQHENNSSMNYGYPDSSFIFSGCLMVNGKYIFLASGNSVSWNNTIIGNADNLLSVHRVNTGSRISFNDIIILRDAAKVIDIVNTGGCVITDGNCIWGNSGAYGGAFGYTAKTGGQAGVRGFNTIDVDPDLDSSYRPRNPQVLRGGSAMLSDGRSQLGAIKQKYQFPQKARIVNHGRLGILK